MSSHYSTIKFSVVQIGLIRKRQHQNGNWKFNWVRTKEGTKINSNIPTTTTTTSTTNQPNNKHTHTSKRNETFTRINYGISTSFGYTAQFLIINQRINNSSIKSHSACQWHWHFFVKGKKMSWNLNKTSWNVVW